MAGDATSAQMAPVALVQRLQVYVAEAVDPSQSPPVHGRAEGGERDD